MDATDLKVFEAVARHGSMNRAAAELNTVQSNVTARVRALELELGVLLFQRHARGVKITPAGRRMLPFSARISKLLSDAKAAARDDGIPSGVLEVGTLETTAALRLPSVLASFTKAYPKVRPVVTTGTTCSLIEDVVECRLEGAFVAGPVDHPDLQQESVFREELVLVTPRSIRGIEDLRLDQRTENHRLPRWLLISNKAGQSVEQGWSTRCTAPGIRFDRSDSGLCGRRRRDHLVAQGYRRRGLARRPDRGA